MPLLNALEAFDQLLSASDPDSMGWTDGGGHELATELLDKFDAAEWKLLASSVAERTPCWRQCLASVLRPQQGDVAAQLLLDLTNDVDGDVAFAALCATAFYCGVNSSARGEFIDSSIRVPTFLTLARSSKSLQRAVQRLDLDGSSPSPFVVRFRLLAREIGS